MFAVTTTTLSNRKQCQSFFSTPSLPPAGVVFCKNTNGDGNNLFPSWRRMMHIITSSQCDDHTRQYKFLLLYVVVVPGTTAVTTTATTSTRLLSLRWCCILLRVICLQKMMIWHYSLHTINSSRALSSKEVELFNSHVYNTVICRPSFHRIWYNTWRY